jgi:hypothetical protein
LSSTLSCSCEDSTRNLPGLHKGEDHSCQVIGTHERVKPSGLMLALTMCKSATGPIAANAEEATKESERSAELKPMTLNNSNRKRGGTKSRGFLDTAVEMRIGSLGQGLIYAPTYTVPFANVKLKHGQVLDVIDTHRPSLPDGYPLCTSLPLEVDPFGRASGTAVDEQTSWGIGMCRRQAPVSGSRLPQH